MNKRINKIFICGCGHTGTTILARIIGNHSKIHLINFETGMFLLNRYYIKDKLIKKFSNEALKKKKFYILEKTPRHIWHVDYINKIIKDPKFILTTRRPEETIYSLYKRYKNLDLAIQRYQDDSIQTLRSLELKNSILIKYEDLILNTEVTLKKICKFLNLRIEKDMINFFKKPIEWNLTNPFSGKKDYHNEKRNMQANLPLSREIKKNEIPLKIKKKINIFLNKKNIGSKIKKQFGY